MQRQAESGGPEALFPVEAQFKTGCGEDLEDALAMLEEFPKVGQRQ